MSDANIFDQKAQEWDRHPAKREMSQLFAAEVKKNVALTATMELLEFGCGTGLVSMELYRQVASITLLDTSPGMIEVVQEKIARHAIGNLQPRLGDLSAIDLAGERFDLIYTNMALHHVADVDKALAGFVQLLKPGGSLCIGDLEPEDGSFHQDETAVQHGFDHNLLASVLTGHGLEVEHCYRSHTLQKTDPAGRIRRYPLFFLQARKPVR